MKVEALHSPGRHHPNRRERLAKARRARPPAAIDHHIRLVPRAAALAGAPTAAAAAKLWAYRLRGVGQQPRLAVRSRPERGRVLSTRRAKARVVDAPV